MLRWDVQTLARYTFNALDHLSDQIRFKALQAQTNDHHLIALFEAVSMTQSYLEMGQDLDQKITVSTGLAEYYPVTPEFAFPEICWALFKNAELLIDTVYKQDSDPLGDCYLAESLLIAITVVEEDGADAIDEDLKNHLICRAEEARAALIRSTIEVAFSSGPQAAGKQSARRFRRAGQGIDAELAAPVASL